MCFAFAKEKNKTMSVETDFVLATPDQAEAVLASHNPSHDFGGVYAKGTDPISLSALLQVLTGNGGCDDFLEDYREVATDPSGEKSVSVVPPALRNSIEALPDEEILDVVSRWMETDEFMLTGWDEQIAVDFIRDLKALLASDGALHKELWMAISV